MHKKFVIGKFQPIKNTIHDFCKLKFIFYFLFPVPFIVRNSLLPTCLTALGQYNTGSTIEIVGS